MRKKIKLILLPLCLILASCSQDESDLMIDEQNSEVTATSSITKEILRLVNEHRQSIGTSVLIRNTTADAIAKEHTDYMISNNEISHDNFDARFQKLRQSVAAKGAGENVAAGYPTAKTVMDAWLNSAGHRANIEGNFTHIGIAAVKDAQDRYYFTQLFYR